MKFYKHKTTGEIIPGNSLDILNMETMINYEDYIDYKLEYMGKIFERLGWILGFIAIQFIISIIGVIYFLY